MWHTRAHQRVIDTVVVPDPFRDLERWRGAPAPVDRIPSNAQRPSELDVTHVRADRDGRAQRPSIQRRPPSAAAHPKKRRGKRDGHRSADRCGLSGSLQSGPDVVEIGVDARSRPTARGRGGGPTRAPPCPEEPGGSSSAEPLLSRSSRALVRERADRLEQMVALKTGDVRRAIHERRSSSARSSPIARSSAEQTTAAASASSRREHREAHQHARGLRWKQRERDHSSVSRSVCCLSTAVRLNRSSAAAAWARCVRSASSASARAAAAAKPIASGSRRDARDAAISRLFSGRRLARRTARARVLLREAGTTTSLRRVPAARAMSRGCECQPVAPAYCRGARRRSRVRSCPSPAWTACRRLRMASIPSTQVECARERRGDLSDLGIGGHRRSRRKCAVPRSGPLPSRTSSDAGLRCHLSRSASQARTLQARQSPRSVRPARRTGQVRWEVVRERHRACAVGSPRQRRGLRHRLACRPRRAVAARTMHTRPAPRPIARLLAQRRAAYVPSPRATDRLRGATREPDRPIASCRSAHQADPSAPRSLARDNVARRHHPLVADAQ